MNWNHRIVNIEGMLHFMEVSYRNHKPVGCNEPFMCSETVAGMGKLVERLDEALSQPVLNYDDIKEDTDVNA